MVRKMRRRKCLWDVTLRATGKFKVLQINLLTHETRITVRLWKMKSNF